jgi:hypothetical protein
MPVVSNTSPLLNLAIINHLFLLPQQFGQVLIPQAVLAELKIDQDLPGSSVLCASNKSNSSFLPFKTIQPAQTDIFRFQQ